MNRPSLPVSVDGRLVPADEARVRVDDPAFAWGMSAFDTLRVEDGAPILVARHVARLRDTCAVLSIHAPPAERLIEMLVDYAAALPPSARPQGALAVRTTIARGDSSLAARVWMTAREIEPVPPDGVVLVLETRFALAGDELDALKTSSRVRPTLAREAARGRGAFDALLRHAHGDVVEATCANVFACIDGDLVTPPLSRGALAGIARGLLLEELARRGAPARERALSLVDLARASEVFLTNSLHGVVPVLSIQGLTKPLPGGAGPVSVDARRRLAEASQREN